MSTKGTIIYTDRVHIYHECIDNHVHVSFQQKDTDERPGMILADITFPMWLSRLLWGLPTRRDYKRFF